MIRIIFFNFLFYGRRATIRLASRRSYLDLSGEKPEKSERTRAY